MSANETTTTGKVSDEDILALFEDADAPVMGTGEVAEAVNITPQAALYRLKKLRERGALARHKIQSNAVVWWPANS